MSNLKITICEITKLTYPEIELKERLVSDCCKAYPKSEEEIISDICPKCGEHCEFIKERENIDEN